MKIGNLEFDGNVFLAPMAGITDTPFRRIVLEFGISAVWTEMISADGIVAARSDFRTIELKGHNVPVIFQITGIKAANMAQAAKVLSEKGAAAIDINMGCPSRRVVGRGAGAALMKNMSLAKEIMRSVRNAVSIPVTAKIRSGWDDKTKNALEFSRMLESEGCDAITIHSRARTKVHSGPADLDIIRELKTNLSVPIIGNGGIYSLEDAREMIEKTSCDGIMIGRGALGRPWFPAKILNRGSFSVFSNGSTTFIEVIKKHLEYERESWGDLRAVRKMRKHIAWYSKGFLQGSEFRKQAFQLESPDEVVTCVENFFGKAVINDF